jgi:hypothetical protein
MIKLGDSRGSFLMPPELDGEHQRLATRWQEFAPNAEHSAMEFVKPGEFLGTVHAQPSERSVDEVVSAANPLEPVSSRTQLKVR